jgi:hypothetical protein
VFQIGGIRIRLFTIQPLDRTLDQAV